MHPAENFDLVVIGAGLYGLAAAKHYRDFHPNEKVVLLDAGSTVGGTWAAHRLYPGLKSNCLLGTYEYPDFPMDANTFGIKPGQHPTGSAIHVYFDAYARKFGLHALMRFNTRVLSAEYRAGEQSYRWELRAIPTSDGKAGPTERVHSPQDQVQILTKRLVVATGLTSDPYIPCLPGAEQFGRPIFHSRDFAHHEDTLKTSKRICVIGAGKTGWDATYAYARAGVKVDWIVRDTGRGPCWMSPPFVTPLKKQLEKLVNTRLLTWFSPCIWGNADGYGGIRAFLHGTALGRILTDAFWAALGNDVMGLNDYDSHPDKTKLKPRTNPLFTGTSFSINTYESDFYDIINDGTVKVHVADVDHLDNSTVYLSDGSVLEVDAILCATGWRQTPPLQFLPDGIQRELGVPCLQPTADPLAASTAQGLEEDDDNLVARADAEIMSTLPRLKVNQPEPSRYHAHSRFMHYRFIVPAPKLDGSQVRDIAFAGSLSNFSNATTAHVQGVWISAYLDRKLVPERDPSPRAVVTASEATDTEPLLSERDSRIHAERMRYEAVLHNRYGLWRYPTEDKSYPDFVFDAVPYLDLLMRDMGLRADRKGSWIKNVLEPYGPGDYRNVAEEWRARNGAKHIY